MTAKEYLCRLHNMEQKINEMKREVAEYRRLANSIPGCNFDAIRVDGTRNLDAPFVKWIHKALDKEHQMEELIKDLPIIKCEIISTIDELEESELKRILIYRYIDWLSWSELACKMYCSVATIRRWHDKALEQIKVPETVSKEEQQQMTDYKN